MNRTIALVAPYAAWMILMAILPQTAWAYAIRGVVTVLLLIAGWYCASSDRKLLLGSLRKLGCADLRLPRSDFPLGLRAAVGLIIGLIVFTIWIAPDFIWKPAELTEASPYCPEVCGWALTIAKLCASAFVISVAEELFFRVWLVEFAGFWWMVVLFAVEHGERWHVGAITGVAYGILAKKYGIFAAIIAHAVTNLVLGLYVIFADKWFYW